MTGNRLVKLSALLQFFENNSELIAEGENAYDLVEDMVFDNDHQILKGLVHTSMRDETYNVEVRFTRDLAIESASCSCSRVQFLCYHMAALLLYGNENLTVVQTLSSRLNEQESLSTSEDETILELPTPKYQAIDRKLTPQEIEKFKNNLKALPFTCGFSWLLSDDPTSDSDS